MFPTPEAVRAFFETQFVYRGPLDFALLLVAFAIVPAICEEILFRGFVQAGFIRIFESVPAGIALTALVFAVFHLDPWRFGGVLILGLFLGFLAHRSGSLVPPVVAHALNNTLSIVLTAATGRSDAEDGEAWMLVAALAFVAVALGLLWPRHSRVAAERVL